MAKKKANATEGEAMAVRLRSPHKAAGWVGTADDPREIDAEGYITMDVSADADLIALLMGEHRFEVCE